MGYNVPTIVSSGESLLTNPNFKTDSIDAELRGLILTVDGAEGILIYIKKITYGNVVKTRIVYELLES